MTIAVLRSLHQIIGHAIDEIESTYASHAQSADPMPSNANSQAYTSPPPSPCTTSSWNPSSPEASNGVGKGSPCPLDFPSLDSPYDPGSVAETLTTHPVVLGAIGRIVAAAGQIGATVQIPFLTLSEAAMGYHLPSCMRLLEASHVVEILREAGPEGLDVHAISQKNGVVPGKLAHSLRLLATHHLIREVSPNVFALNRLSSLIDSGKTFTQLKQFEIEGRPEMKYSDTNGNAAFVGLCTDEIQKSAAYMTETYYLSPSQRTRAGVDPVQAPFCFAFDTAKSGTGFFGWLEGETSNTSAILTNDDEGSSIKTGRGGAFPSILRETSSQNLRHRQDRSMSDEGRHAHRSLKNTNAQVRKKRSAAANANAAIVQSLSPASTDSDSVETAREYADTNPNRFNLERFGKAMSGTNGWEMPGAVLNGFEWASLPQGSIVVDVGGGIGSTTMILATAFTSKNGDEAHLKFIIQDRAVVCEMGEKAWKDKRPEILGTTVKFQVHDFFTPQPVKDAAVFLLRVVLHDWPDKFARNILLRLREAASSDTKLVIADFVLPLACPDDTNSDSILEDVVGAESVLAPAPLLPNLGKASSNVYCMDLTMQVMFNAQERTLRELVMLASSAGWKVIKVTKMPGSLFGYLVAVPISIPARSEDDESQILKNEPFCNVQASVGDHDQNKSSRMTYCQSRYRKEIDIQRSSSRCGTPTFGSGMKLSSVEETLSRFGGGSGRSKTYSRTVSSASTAMSKTVPDLKPALSLSSSFSTKKKPSPLTMPPTNSSPTPMQSPRWPSSTSASPRNEQFKGYSPPAAPTPRPMVRRMSSANLRSHSQHATMGPPPPLPALRQQPPSPLSPLRGCGPSVRQATQVQISPRATGHISSPHSPQPNFIPVRASKSTEPTSTRRPLHSFGTFEEVTPPEGLFRPLGGVITRRASTAQLPQVSVRKRSRTIIGERHADGICSASNAGTMLRFDQIGEKNSTQRNSSSTRPRSPVLKLKGIGVLAAAAKIDNGHFDSLAPP
ncbi:hypothetical protein BDN70DRAFT_924124 [Pholiota conissans]|uniref:O-methyltransferase C-terminal domain-containing protein n=1 Tax=Pholiota conissans TaxID=109636 RepID=A0A9P6CPY0_9AGAR|nr:hypothetical protein BDN70DRAFT_924124 [Pholiota conissans]